jgi:hypothetical protein
MELFSVIMSAAVGLAVGHIAHKTSEGGINLWLALGLGLAGALAGGLAAVLAGVKFYGPFGHMVIAGASATLCFLIWRQLRA